MKACAVNSVLACRHEACQPFMLQFDLLENISMNETHMRHPRAAHQAMQPCIEACSDCHKTCLHTALAHCLVTGGSNVEASHFRLMINCAEICQTSANFLLSGSDFHHNVCAVCADICDACAASCEQVGGMDDCVQACRACAQSCRQMAGSQQFSQQSAYGIQENIS